MPALAGRRALVKVSGAAVAFTDEATTDSGDHQTYQITSATKRVWDPFLAITVKVGGVTTVETYSLHRLSGSIVFATVNGARGTVTVSGSYLPLSTALEGKTFSYALTAQNIADNSFGDEYVSRVQAARDVTGSIGRWFVDTFFSAALVADTQLVFQFFVDNSGVADLTCWGRLSRRSVQMALRGLTEEMLEFEGTTDGGADGLL